jgi:hypothetical protein
VEQLLKEFKYVFAWTYKDLEGIPPKLAQHKIELDTTISPTHTSRNQPKCNHYVCDYMQFVVIYN